MTQDIYGQWQTGPRGRLFLAPDRVLFAENERWDQAVMLAEIREVGAFERPDLRHKIDPWAQALLRIECRTTPADKPYVFGFLVRDAEEWATAIQSLSPARITIRSGQKKSTNPHRSASARAQQAVPVPD
jgi:hypothetical protein